MMTKRKRTYLIGGLVAAAATSGFIFGRVTDRAGSAPDDARTMDMAGQQGASGASGMSGMEGMDDGGAVRLSSTDIGTFGITFGTVDVRRLERTIRAVGLVDFDETRVVHVSPKFGGWVETLHVDFTGMAVRAGEPLLEVYSPELVTAQEELLLAADMAASVSDSRVVSASTGAGDLLASARRRLAYWDISEEQIARLLETGEVRKTLTLYAPTSGVVVEKNVFAGQSFGAGTNLYVIADLSSVWVNAVVFEADAVLLREGMPVELTVAALPARSFRGRVEFVYPTLEDRTRSLRARVSIANPRGELKPGMYATVTLDADLGEVLSVANSAVLYSGERAVTFVDMGGGELMPQEVELGLRGAGHVQVLTGLEPGQRVVTSAQFLLDSESNLAEVMKAMMAQMNLSDIGGMDMGTMEMGADPMAGMQMPDTGGRR